MLENTIKTILEDYMRTVRYNMATLNINASHRTERSLHMVKTNDGFQVIIGGANTAPAETLQTGWPPGKVPKGFTDIIFQWMKDKGIPGDKNVAFLIANKIKREGTERFKHPVDVYTKAGKDVAEQLQHGLGAYLANRIIQSK